jgi:ribose/xylose/arabinose/galactoside ABC-type transport system permease subunit
VVQGDFSGARRIRTADLLGAILRTGPLVNNALNLLNVEPDWQEITGTIIIVAMLANAAAERE